MCPGQVGGQAARCNRYGGAQKRRAPYAAHVAPGWRRHAARPLLSLFKRKEGKNERENVPAKSSKVEAHTPLTLSLSRSRFLSLFLSLALAFSLPPSLDGIQTHVSRAGGRATSVFYYIVNYVLLFYCIVNCI